MDDVESHPCDLNLTDIPCFEIGQEIETVTVYTLQDDGRITARQRTATFLSNRDPR